MIYSGPVFGATQGSIHILPNIFSPHVLTSSPRNKRETLEYFNIVKGEGLSAPSPAFKPASVR